MNGYLSLGEVIQYPAAEVTNNDSVLYYFLGSVTPRICCQLKETASGQCY